MIFSNGRDLLIGDIHGNNLRTLVNSQNRGVAVGVDFHYTLHRIFWTDTIQNKVFFIHFLKLFFLMPIYLYKVDPFLFRMYRVRLELASTEFFQLSFKISAMLIL